MIFDIVEYILTVTQTNKNIHHTDDSHEMEVVDEKENVHVSVVTDMIVRHTQHGWECENFDFDELFLTFIPMCLVK